jgi:hypothetical protein
MPIASALRIIRSMTSDSLLDTLLTRFHPFAAPPEGVPRKCGHDLASVAIVYDAREHPAQSLCPHAAASKC